jgi:hypothetical protein
MKHKSINQHLLSSCIHPFQYLSISFYTARALQHLSRFASEPKIGLPRIGTISEYGCFFSPPLAKLGRVVYSGQRIERG